MEESNDGDPQVPESPSTSWYMPASPAEPAAAVTTLGTAERNAIEGFKGYSTREPPLTQIARMTRAKKVGYVSIPSSSADFGSNNGTADEGSGMVIGARFGLYRPHFLEASSPESIEDTPMSDSPRTSSPVLSAPEEAANTAPPPASVEFTIPHEFRQLGLEQERTRSPKKNSWKIVTRQEFQASKQKEAAKELSRRMFLPDSPQLQMNNDRFMNSPNDAGATLTTGPILQPEVAVLDFAVAPDSRVPIAQATKAATAAARINEQLKIKKAIEARSKISMNQTTTAEQLARTANCMNEHPRVQQSAVGPQLSIHDNQPRIDQSIRESQLIMGREEEISLKTSIWESQPSNSADTPVLGPNEEHRNQGVWTAVPTLSSRAAHLDDNRPILRHAFICGLCNRPGHRWMDCINACKRCGQWHNGYLTCTSQDKKRKDDGEGEGRGGSKRLRRGAISKWITVKKGLFGKA